MSEQITPVEILRAARSRIENKRHWTRYKAARDRYGHGVDPIDNRAVRWCVAGAVLCETDGWTEMPAGQSAWDFLLQTLVPEESPQQINDLRGHGAVLQMLDRAIALAAADGRGADGGPTR